MAMPEAAIGKDDRVIPWKDQIRLPGQLLLMKSEAEATGMQAFAQYQFGLCVASPDRSHIAAAGSRIVNVSQLCGYPPARRS